MSRMSVRVTAWCASVLSLCVLSALPRRSQGQNLLTNGDFETGTLAGCAVADQLNPGDVANADYFYLSTPGANTPAVKGVSFATAANPAGGSFYVLTASDSPGAHALLQNFTVPTSTYLLKSLLSNVRQRPVRFDTSGNLIPNPFTTYTADLTGMLTPGSSYRLRFGEVDNLSSINQGVDNVRLLAVTPEPGGVGLLCALGMTSSFGLLRRRRLTPQSNLVSRLLRRTSR